MQDEAIKNEEIPDQRLDGTMGFTTEQYIPLKETDQKIIRLLSLPQTTP